MKRKELTQYDRVLRYLKDTGSITQIDAIREFGAYRLSAIILNLRKNGYNIQTEFKTSMNRYGEPTSYGVYKLVEENEIGE